MTEIISAKPSTCYVLVSLNKQNANLASHQNLQMLLEYEINSLPNS